MDDKMRSPLPTVVPVALAQTLTVWGAVSELQNRISLTRAAYCEGTT
jgi:hypothetical protein